MHSLGIEAASTPSVMPSKATAFFAALALVTILPLLLLPLIGGYLPQNMNVPILVIWIAAGFSHVMATTWFGLDSDYREVVSAHPFRMMGSFVLAPMALMLVVMTSSSISGWVFMTYMIWQSHHYNRQNYGIMSFAAAHDGTGPLPPQINWILHLTTAAGAMIMGSMPAIYGPGADLPWLVTAVPHEAWQAVETVCLVAATALALHVVATNAVVRRSPVLLLFLGLSLAFYLPGLLFPNSPVTGFWPYAMAHGAQYLVIMSVTAGRSQRGLAGMVIFMLLAAVLGVTAYMMRGVPWAAMYSGIVVWHFLADARLWRLRDPVVRSIVRKRFDFVFSSPRATRTSGGFEPVHAARAGGLLPAFSTE